MRIFNKDLNWDHIDPRRIEQLDFPEFTLEVLRPLDRIQELLIPVVPV